MSRAHPTPPTHHLTSFASLQVLTFDLCARAECYSEASDHEEAESTEIPPPPYTDQTLRGSGGASRPPGGTHQVSRPDALRSAQREVLTVFSVFQGTLPPPYSSAVPAAANGPPSSPVSTMTSHSSSSSLTKQRQSWLDLVSQASTAPAAATSPETAVVCSVQVHLQRAPAEEVDGEALESSSQPDSLDAESNEENAAAEEEEASQPPGGEAGGGFCTCA